MSPKTRALRLPIAAFGQFIRSTVEELAQQEHGGVKVIAWDDGSVVQAGKTIGNWCVRNGQIVYTPRED